MVSVRVRDALRALARNSAACMLVLTTSALLAGLVLHALGAASAGNGAWAAAGSWSRAARYWSGSPGAPPC